MHTDGSLHAPEKLHASEMDINTERNMLETLIILICILNIIQ